MAGLGDGLAAVALPLLATGITTEPLPVASVFAAQHVAWLLVAAVGGRLLATPDRRTTLGAVNTVRAMAVGGLGYLVISGNQTILSLQLVAFVVGLGEVLSDDGELAGADTLASSRGAGEVTGGLGSRGMFLVVIGLIVGGLSYDVFAAMPLLLGVAIFSFAALWALAVNRTLLPTGGEAGGSALGALTAARVSLPSGLRLPAAVAALTAACNGAVLGILVLLAVEDLALGALAFGLLLSAMAGGSAAGGLLAPEAGRLLGVRAGLVAALVAAGGAVAAAGLLASPDAPYVAAAALVLASAASTAAVVLVRVAFHTRTARPVERSSVRALQLATWAGIPVGAVAAGAAAGSLGVSQVLVAAGVVTIVAAAVSATLRPAPVEEAGTDPAAWTTRPVHPA